MSQVQIPLFPIDQKTTWSEFPDIVEVFATHFEERTGDFPPMLIFEPSEKLFAPGSKFNVSEAPEEIIVVSISPDVSNAMFEALKRVEAREPKGIPYQSKPVKIKDNTPIKSIFRQMAAMPVTVYSLTFLLSDSDSITVFFVRTPFTVSEFRREMEMPIT